MTAICCRLNRLYTAENEVRSKVYDIGKRERPAGRSLKFIRDVYPMILFSFILFAVKNEVCNNAEDKSAGNGGELYVLFAEGHYHTAYAGD